jgi:glyoxylase-like metal-dependent hydrolase (beta-lactamase superfamily II)
MAEKITENVFAFCSPNEGSNCYLLKGRRNILIDSSVAANEGYLRKSLKECGVAPENIDIVLHTHGHADHFGNSSIFPEATLMMHEHDAERVNKKDVSFTFSHFFPDTGFPHIGKSLKEGEDISNGTFSIKVISTPGHTKGSVCFYEKEKGLLFSGDCLFSKGVGRCDFPSSSERDMVSSLGKLKELEYRILLPGHGPLLKEGQRSNIEDALHLLSP